MNVTVKGLDHVNLRTAALDAMVAWYGDVLGMRPGPRPGFSFPGAWLYTGDQAVLHLVGVDDPPSADAGSLRLEHFALSAEGMAAFVERLEARGERYRLNRIEDFGIVQVNLWDPDGNHIHVDFNAGEEAI